MLDNGSNFWYLYVSKMQSESKLCYLNTAYSVLFQLENLSSQTSIFPGSRLLSTSLQSRLKV